MSEGYGQHYESMYSGSMVGCGALMFAVMGYIISKTRPRTHTIELNPVLLAATFGESVEDIESTIEKLCSPDPKSRSKNEDGRRLIRRGEFEFFVVNHEYYRGLASKERRRKYQADLMEKRREADKRAFNANNMLTGANSPASASASASVSGGDSQGEVVSRPSAAEFKEFCTSPRCGLLPAEADDLWLKCLSTGWKAGQSHITDWQAYACRMRKFYEQDRNGQRKNSRGGAPDRNAGTYNDPSAYRYAAKRAGEDPIDQVP